MISQLRLAHHSLIKISWNKIIYKIDTKQICTLCNLGAQEDLQHLLLKCPIYTPLREKYLKTHLLRENASEISDFELVKVMLNTSNIEYINDLFYFAINALQVRSFIINE